MRSAENGRPQGEWPLGLAWKKTLAVNPSPDNVREALAITRDPLTRDLDREVVEGALFAYVLPVVEAVSRKTLRSSRARLSARSELFGDAQTAALEAIREAPEDVKNLRGWVRCALQGVKATATARDFGHEASCKRQPALARRRDWLTQVYGRDADYHLVAWDLARERGEPLSDVEIESIRLALFPPRARAADGEGALLLGDGSPAGVALMADAAAPDAALAEVELAAELRDAIRQAAERRGDAKAVQHLAITVLQDKDFGPGLTFSEIDRLLEVERPLIQPRFGSAQGLTAQPWPFWRRAMNLPDGIADEWVDVQRAFVSVKRGVDNVRHASKAPLVGEAPRSISAWSAWRTAALVLLAALGASAPDAQPESAEHARAHGTQSNESFLASFDYAEYLRRVPFTDLQAIQRDRHDLWRLRDRGDDVGDHFVYQLAETFAREYPISHASLGANVTIGEIYLRGRPTGNANGDAIFRVVGYHQLGRVARFLETEAGAGRLDLDDYAPVLDRLAANNVYVEKPETARQKVWRNLRSFKVGYLFKRLWSSITGGRGRGGYTLRDKGAFAQGAAHAFELLDDGHSAGFAVWLDRPAVAARYVARPGHYPSAAARADAEAQASGRNRVVALSGGFTNHAGQPEGLTLDRGDVVNAVVMPERHGLVIIESTGGIRVVDLGAGVVRVQDGHRILALRPLQSLADYGALLAWGRRQGATIFQTQLLAFGGQLRIDPAKAPREARERRFLALVRAPAGTVQHVVLDLTRPAALADAAADAKTLLEDRGLHVEAILNLDVGTYNAFQLWDDAGQPHPDVHGPVPLSRATNLLLYTR